jgi:hypothetical protein
MRTPIITLLMLLITQLSIAQENSKQSDTLTKKRNPTKQNFLFIKLNSVNTFGAIKPGASNYNFKSMFGTGAECIIGFKLNPKMAFGVGLQRSQFFLNQSKVEKALDETYSQPWMSAKVTTLGRSNLKQMSYLVYLSSWQQKKRSILEYYAKMSLASFQYDLNSTVNRFSNTNYTIVSSYEGGLSSTNFVAAIGANYSIPISKIFYIGAGLQYGFNLSGKSYLYEYNTYSTGAKVTYQIQLPVPSHLLQANIGMMYRPKKACNCKEQKPW